MENETVDIGSQLKARREKLGLSLQDAAQHTCIRKTFLESIEKNQFADLPGQAYVTGFIKSYARYLGVDNEPLIAQLEETLADAPLSLKPISVARHNSTRFKKSPSGIGRSGFFFGFVAVIILGGAIYLLTPMFQDRVPTEVAVELVVPEKELVQKPVKKQVEVSVESVEKPVIEEEVVTLLPEEKLEPAATEMKPSELKPLPLIPSGGASLRMLALSEGSLIIYLDKRKSQSYKLRAGLDLTWNVKESATVELAGPGMARFWLGGQELELGEMDSFQLHADAGD